MPSHAPYVNRKIVWAGAGAGKTTGLVKEVLDRAEDFYKNSDPDPKKKRWPRVVLTTFTRMATQELRERVLLEALRRPSIDTQDTGLVDFASSSYYLRISTMHALLSQFMSQNAKVFNLDPQFRVLQESSELERLKRRVFLKLIKAHPDASLLLDAYDIKTWLKFLSEYYRNSFLHPDAKPQSMRSMLEGFRDWQIKREREFKDLCHEHSAVLQNDRWLKWKRPLESFWDWGETLLKKSTTHNFEPLAKECADGAKQAFKSYVPSGKLKVKEISEWSKDTGGEFLSFSLENFLKQEQHNALLKSIGDSFVKEFYKEKTALQILETDDLENFVSFAKNTGALEANKLDLGADYVFIDEYQDTSPVQVSIVESLFRSGKGIYYVGDPQQSIYLFRGADASLFKKTYDKIKSNKGQVERKSINYRSSASVLEFVNDFFSKLNQDVKNSNFVRMEPHKEQLVPDAMAGVRLFCVEQADDTKGSELSLAPVASLVQDLISKGVRERDICVLARQNDSLLNVAQALRSCGHGVQLYAAGSLFQKREVQDALFVLRFLLSPYDNTNLVALLRTPYFKVLDKTLGDWLFNIKAKHFWDIVQHKNHEPVEALCRYLELKNEMPFADLFLKILCDRGFLDFLDFDPTRRTESNLWNLYMRVREVFTSASPQPLDLFNKIESENSCQEGLAARGTGCVKLMTVHKSKGLEFEHVILVDAHKKSRASIRGFMFLDEDTLLWNAKMQKGWRESGANLDKVSGKNADTNSSFFIKQQNDKLKAREEAESQRLLYVAMTRAKKSLSIFWQRAKSAPSQTAAKKTSASWADLLEEFCPDKVERVLEERGDGGHVAHAKSSSVSEEVRGDALESESDCNKTRSAPAATAAHNIQGFLARSNSQAVGVQVHAAFERLQHWSAKECAVWLRDLAGISVANQWLGCVESLFKRKDFPYSKLLKQGFAEWGFLHKKYGAGRIDLWGEVDGCLWVVDYKTGHALQTHAQKHLVKHINQLKTYALALRGCGDQYVASQKTRLALVYMEASRLHTEEM